MDSDFSDIDTYNENEEQELLCETDEDLEEPTLTRQHTQTQSIKSINRLTKYEKCRLLSIRTHQLLLGCKTVLPQKEVKGLSYLQIARKELETGRIPLLTIRKFRNGFTEII